MHPRCLTVHLPTAIPELLIDNGPGSHFIEIDRLCRFSRLLGHLLNRGWRRGRGGLQLCQFGGKSRARGVRFGSELFPNSPVFLLLSRALLRRKTRALMLLGFSPCPFSCGLRCGKLFAQPRQLGVQRCRRRHGVRRWDEWAGFKSSRLPKGAMKPDAQLPRDFQPGQRFVMRSRKVVCGAVACDPQLVEEIAYFPRSDPIEIKPTEQVGLRLIG